MASSVSGPDDYAQTIYYSHTQYNSGTVAEQSNKTELLTTQMMENQSNYQVGIDKLKISSLDGVILSYFPQNQLKLGLQITNAASITKYAETTLIKPGFVDTFVQQLQHFYCSYTNNSNIVNVFNSQGFTQNITIPRLPNKVFYNTVNNFLYYHDNVVLYSYDIEKETETKEDQTTYLATGIYNMDYNEISQQLVLTSGSSVFTQYDVIPATGRLSLINTYSFSYLENITACQVGSLYIYLVSNIDINYISATQTLFIYDFTGSLLSSHLQPSSFNMIRQIECKYEDNLFNFFCEGTIANYTTSTAGGAYIPCIIGRNGSSGTEEVDRLLTNYTQETLIVNIDLNQIGNYVFNVNNSKIYASVMSNLGTSYVIETYSNITTPQSFQLQSGQPNTSPLPVNVIDGITFFCRYITYMRFYNVNYLLSSVIASDSQIQIYILNLDSAIPASINYTFYSSTLGSSSLNINTIIAPSTGFTNSIIAVDPYSENDVPSFLGNNKTSNIAFGTGLHYYFVVNDIIYVYQYGNNTPPITYNMSSLLEEQSIVVAITVIQDTCYTIVAQPDPQRYIITAITNILGANVLQGFNYDPVAIFTSISSIPDFISLNVISLGVSNAIIYQISTDFAIVSNNQYQTPSFTYTQLSPYVNNNYFLNIDTQPNQFSLNNYSGGNPPVIYTLRTPNEKFVDFLGFDYSSNLLVLSQNTMTEIFYLNAFSINTPTLIYYTESGRILATSQYTEENVPPVQAVWQLYQTISPTIFPIDMGNNQYPMNDTSTHITVDEHYNLLLSYCNQGITSNQGVYYTVLLTPPASANNQIIINTSSYVPINISLNYRDFQLGFPGDGTLQNTNLMYDNLMKCYYARYNNILLKGFLDLQHNRINFIDYFNFNLLNSNLFISQYGQFMYCIENAQYTNQVNQYSPSILSLYSIQTTTTTTEFLNQTLQKYIEPVITYNLLEQYYIFSSDVVNGLNYYTNNQSQLTYIKTLSIPQFTKITNTFAYTVAPPTPLSQLAVYSLQEYVDSINNAFNVILILLNSNGFTSTVVAPFVSMNWQTGYLTLNYDPAMRDANFGIFVNDALLNYMKFQVSPSATPFLSNKYVLNSENYNIQSKLSFLKFNTIDKIIVNSTMSIIGDQVGGNTQSIVFTDLDLNMNDPVFLNMSGNFIYEPSLIRNYTLVSNQGLRSINYSVVIRYLDKSELPFLIQPGENISIKFIFTRIY